MQKDSLILKNKELPAAIEAVVDREVDGGNEVLFVIAGDLNLKGRYAPTALIFTWDSVLYVDADSGEESRFMFSDMTEVVSKRMYGNATLSAIMPNGKRVVFFRYTYSVASLCDAAALFINHIRDGEERNASPIALMILSRQSRSIDRVRWNRFLSISRQDIIPKRFNTRIRCSNRSFARRMDVLSIKNRL